VNTFKKTHTQEEEDENFDNYSHWSLCSKFTDATREHIIMEVFTTAGVRGTWVPYFKNF